jgi:hypothetical protein
MAKINTSNRRDLILESTTLRNGRYWYEVGGQLHFPVYGCSGGLTISFVAMLVEKPPNAAVDFGQQGLHDDAALGCDCGGRWFTISILDNDSDEVLRRKIHEAIEALNGD